MSALLLTACRGPAEDAPSESASTSSVAEATTQPEPEVTVTVSASTTHDDGAILTWGAQRQEVSDGGDFSMTFDSAPEPGTEFVLSATGAPQSSAVICEIAVGGELVERDQGAGSMPSAMCTMPVLNG